ncbi:MAG: hypothetical protein NDI69_13565 [Bacteriovoracaceae bacterium]|nr:hypothetical protein [Bacteriovoracaceae bacterium]
MKTSLTKLSSSFLLLSLSLSVWAKPVAQVTQISGKAFVVTDDGKTTALRLNQHLDERSEIMVSDDASITLNDYYNATYHLTGGSHLKFFNQSVQLKNGKAWIQSMNSKHPLALTTANGYVNFLNGEFITIFDQGTSRSQVLVVNGEVDVSNVLDQDMKYTVPAGSFTVVDPEIENGFPRAPTKIGLQSLNAALAEFKSLPTQIKSTEVHTRSIASVSEVPVKKGEIIYIKSHRLPASVKKYRNKKANSEPATPIPIKIYGTSWKNNQAYSAPRTPASIQVNNPSLPKISDPKLLNDPEFENSLKKQAVKQPKYSKELEKLIEDLKSY